MENGATEISRRRTQTSRHIGLHVFARGSVIAKFAPQDRRRTPCATQSNVFFGKCHVQFTLPSDILNVFTARGLSNGHATFVQQPRPHARSPQSHGAHGNSTRNGSPTRVVSASKSATRTRAPTQREREREHS